jgi:hypothetical protein
MSMDYGVWSGQEGQRKSSEKHTELDLRDEKGKRTPFLEAENTMNKGTVVGERI